MFYVITHGERNFGPNPSHKPEGIARVKSLSLPKGIPLVVVGTGKRFLEIWRFLKDKLSGIPVKYSSFCGSADGLESDGTIVLADGTIVNRSDYVGLEKAVTFDAWKFLAEFPENTLFCAGGELMIALGLGGITEKGQLYELNPETKTGHKIS